MSAGKHSGRQRIVRVVAVVLLGVGDADPVTVLDKLPHLSKRHYQTTYEGPRHKTHADVAVDFIGCTSPDPLWSSATAK